MLNLASCLCNNDVIFASGKIARNEKVTADFRFKKNGQKIVGQNIQKSM